MSFESGRPPGSITDELTDTGAVDAATSGRDDRAGAVADARLADESSEDSAASAVTTNRPASPSPPATSTQRRRPFGRGGANIAAPVMPTGTDGPAPPAA